MVGFSPEGIARGVVRLPDAMAVRISGDGDGLSENAVDLLVANLDILVDCIALWDEGWVLARVESPERRHGAHDHAHRVRVVAEGLQHKFVLV